MCEERPSSSLSPEVPALPSIGVGVPRGEDGPREKNLKGETALGTGTLEGKARKRGFLVPCPLLRVSPPASSPASPTWSPAPLMLPGAHLCCSCLYKGATVSCWGLRGRGDGGVKDGRGACPHPVWPGPRGGLLPPHILPGSLLDPCPGNQGRFSPARPATSLPSLTPLNFARLHTE